MTMIKLVLKPVEPTAPTITPAVAIAIPTPTIFKAPFSNPTTVSLNQFLNAFLKLDSLINLFARSISAIPFKPSFRASR